jgi:hypothetical protein
MPLRGSNSTKVLAGQRCKSLGVLTVSLPTPKIILMLDVYVLKPDISTLLGLDVHDRHVLQFLNSENALDAVKRVVNDQ